MEIMMRNKKKYELTMLHGESTCDVVAHSHYLVVKLTSGRLKCFRLSIKVTRKKFVTIQAIQKYGRQRQDITQDVLED